MLTPSWYCASPRRRFGLTRPLGALGAALVVATLLWGSGCGEESGGAPPDEPWETASFEAQIPGPERVGHATFMFSRTDGAGERSFAVEVWYPAAGVVGEFSLLQDLEADEGRREALAQRVAEAPEGCLRERIGAERDVPARIRPGAPVLLYSHCHVCTRWSGSAMAERLASHGFVVLAPDHEGNTLWDDLAGDAAAVGAPFLRVRADDIHALVAALRAGPGQELLPPMLLLENPRIGVFGHSFGAVTAGLVAQEDAAVAAAFAVAAPMSNPLVPGVRMTEIGDRPLGFLLAEEDNSITSAGNSLIRGNFRDAAGPKLLASVADMGHWGMSDVPALVPMFSPGCGEGARMTSPRDLFTYLDPEEGRALAAGVVTAFFVEVFAGPEAAAEALDALAAVPGLSVER